MTSNKFLQFFLLAAVSLFIGSCAQQSKQDPGSENVQHFRHILFSESPWDPIQGTHQISAEEAMTINNYKFTYDDQKRLTSVEFCRDTNLLEGSSLRAAKIVISYEDNKEIRQFFDFKNEPISMAGDVYKYVYEMDETGFYTGMKFYGKDNEPIENRNGIGYYTWSKTPLGMIKENRYTLAGEETVLSEFCPFYELRFSYDDKGRVTRMANYEKDKLYDCTAENCGNIGVSYFDFVMDEKGGLLQFSVHSTTGQLSNLYWGWAKFTLELDENGNVLEQAMYDQDDEFVGGKMIPIRQYTYDESGSVIEEKYLDANRQLMNNPNDTVAVKQYRYDAFGHKTETILFDKDMNQKES